jgi:hypothetical protein
LGVSGSHTALFHVRSHRNQGSAADHTSGVLHGFVGAGLAWQIAFLIIATDPVRFRPIIPAAVVEKFTYGVALIVLHLQGRLHAADLTFAGTDLLLGILFIAAFVKTRSTT